MRVMITPDGQKEFHELLNGSTQDQHDAVRALAALEHGARNKMVPARSALLKPTEGNENIWVMKTGKVRVFFTWATEQMIVLGLTSTPSLFDPKTRLKDYLSGAES